MEETALGHSAVSCEHKHITHTTTYNKLTTTVNDTKALITIVVGQKKTMKQSSKSFSTINCIYLLTPIKKFLDNDSAFLTTCSTCQQNEEKKSLAIPTMDNGVNMA